MNPKDGIVLITGANECIDTALMMRLREDFDNLIGVIDHVGEPFSAGTNPLNGTEAINSFDLSRASPMSDSGFGAKTSRSGTRSR